MEAICISETKDLITDYNVLYPTKENTSERSIEELEIPHVIRQWRMPY
jgi:hypothetical protein